MDSGFVQAGVAVLINVLALAFFGGVLFNRVKKNECELTTMREDMEKQDGKTSTRIDTEAQLRTILSERVNALEVQSAKTATHIEHFTQHARETSESMREIRDMLLTTRVTPSPHNKT